jgi:hypothetical protein
MTKLFSKKRSEEIGRLLTDEELAHVVGGYGQGDDDDDDDDIGTVVTGGGTEGDDEDGDFGDGTGGNEDYGDNGDDDDDDDAGDAGDEIVVNGITPALELKLRATAHDATVAVVALALLATGGIALESALFNRLVGVVGDGWAKFLSGAGAFGVDQALQEAIEQSIYERLLADAIKDFDDDGKINGSQDLKKGLEELERQIKEYNDYVNDPTDDPLYGID